MDHCGKLIFKKVFHEKILEHFFGFLAGFGTLFIFCAKIMCWQLMEIKKEFGSILKSVPKSRSNGTLFWDLEHFLGEILAVAAGHREKKKLPGADK